MLRVFGAGAFPRVPNLSSFLNTSAQPCTVLAWGGGLSGALGNGGTRNEPRPLAVTALPPDVCIVSCGDSWSAACTESGTLYTWGKGQYGRLGHGDVSDVTVPRRMTALDGRRVVSLATGGCHGAVVVEGGDVFAWGRNWHGELGVSDTKAGSAPVIVSMDEGVRAAAVAAGARHTLVLDETGQVWACGQCADGQLGTGGRDKAVSKMTLVPLPSGAKATQVACGRDFSIVVLADGRVLSCGADDYGQLGQGKANRYESSMREIKHLQGIHVQSVSCGDYHVAACDRQGRVYAWGYGRFGQLGTGATTDLSVPTLVPNLENITSVSCGQNHAAAITRKGGLFVWGKGREGQLGRGDELESPVAYRTVPMAVDAIPSSCRVHQVSCGASHTLCTVAC